MKIFTSDYKKSVDVGTGSVWYSVFSTASVRLSADDQDFLQYAMDFLRTGECNADDAQITARQMELVMKRFARLLPADAVFDMAHPGKHAPWHNNLSEQVTSCANLYTTADGKNLLIEVIDLLKYAANNSVDANVT